MLKVRLLGKFEVKDKQKAVNISSRPAQSLFAYLILNAGSSHRREKLAGLLWPDSLEETARDNLRHALWRMRKALESASSARFLQADDVAIGFKESSDYWLDAVALEKLSENATADESIAVLSEYQGELLPGFYDEWVVLEREHIYSIFEHHMARLMSLLQNEKRWLDILDWGERWIKVGQKPEPAYRALMSAHAAKGDMSKVVAAYERCAKALKEFGIEPSEQTRALYERLKAGKEIFEPVPAILVTEKRKQSPKTNLPIPLTSFIGREKELEEIVQLLGKHRLVTLTGLGGVGKTRLAIQSSNEVPGKFKDGVWWVELAPLMDEALVPQAVAQALGMREFSDQPLTETVKSFLVQKQLLLVLDNCEHLIAASAQLAFDLLSHCANLKILATSREPLGITGEIMHPVPTLSYPPLESVALTDLLLEYESVRLFVERARAVKSDFVLTDQNAAAVLQICQRLEGISLALELAAARTRLLTAEQIAERLKDGFNLLTQGSRTALPRHQTLRAAIDWSHNLLTGPEQVLFRRLAIFVGGFTLEAVETVAAGGAISRSEIPDLLSQLIDKSLVTARADAEGSETRYGMLETIRLYAREKLDESGETEQLRQSHRDYFIALAEKAEPKLQGGEHFEWLDRLEREHDNVRSAWDYAIETDPGLALRLVSALLDFWWGRGNPHEGEEWSTKLLSQTGHWGQTARRARVLGVSGWLKYMNRNFAAGRPLLEESLSIARALDDKRQLAFALEWLGEIAYRQRDDETTQKYAEDCFPIYQELQDKRGMARAISQLANVATDQGRYAEAEKLTNDCLARLKEFDGRHGLREAYMLNGLGELARTRGDYEQAGRLYEETLAILRNLRGRTVMAAPVYNLGWVSLRRGDSRKARAFFEEGLSYYGEHDNKDAMTYCLSGFAAILGMTGKPEEAATLFGAMESSYERLGDRVMDASDQKEIDFYLEPVQRQLDEPSFAKAWEEGRAMTLEQAIEFAFKETKQ